MSIKITRGRAPGVVVMTLEDGSTLTINRGSLFHALNRLDSGWDVYIDAVHTNPRQAEILTVNTGDWLTVTRDGETFTAQATAPGHRAGCQARPIDDPDAEHFFGWFSLRIRERLPEGWSYDPEWSVYWRGRHLGVAIHGGVWCISRDASPWVPLGVDHDITPEGVRAVLGGVE